MTTVKISFQKSTSEHCPGSIYFRITKGRITHRITTDLHLYPEEWDRTRSAVILDSKSPRINLLRTIKDEILACSARINRIIQSLEADNVSYTAADIVTGYQNYERRYSLFVYMEYLIERMKENNKIGTSQTYHAALNSFRHFRDGKDLLIDSISTEIMESYEAWLLMRGVVPNTVSFYIRIIRAVYNRLVDHDIIDDHRPFRHVYTGVDKTEKRALPLRIIRKIRNMEFGGDSRLEYARDMFMMSFYLRGMSFVDMAFLRKTDLRKGRITYRRRKTGKSLVIAWTAEMQHLLDKYPENKSDYLLPIIRKTGVNERTVYRNVEFRINRSLRKIGDMLRAPVNLTMYVARHSWASAAKSKGIPLGIISEGMGHDSETTTRIYLASFETSLIDRANTLILSSL